MEAPPAQPRFDFGPPPSPPPAQAPPGQRRFNFLFVGLTILVAIALVGGLLLYSHKAKKPSPAAQQKAAVEQAYLHYDAVAAEALKTLDTTQVSPLLSDSALGAEQATLQQAQQSGFRFQVTDDHDMQTVVYSEGSRASVDDNLVRHIVRLDKSSLASLGPESVTGIHESIALTKVNSRWLIDSTVVFGTSTGDAGSPVSYVAASRGTAVSPALKEQVASAYSQFWAANKRAVETADVAPLAQVELEPELGQDQAAVAELRQKNQAVNASIEHNYRIAQQDASTAWVYDTFLGKSFSYDMSTRRVVDAPSISLVRKSFRLKIVGTTWKVDFIFLNQQ